MTLRRLYKMRLTKTNYILIIVIILSFLGFLDATYLTIIHYKGIIPPCTIAHGCDTVLTSGFSEIFGIPVALLGSLYYLVLIILSITLIGKLRIPILRAVFAIAMVATLVSIILVYLQFAVIHAFCQYCLASEAITFLIFAIVLYLLRVYK